MFVGDEIVYSLYAIWFSFIFKFKVRLMDLNFYFIAYASSTYSTQCTFVCVRSFFLRRFNTIGFRVFVAVFWSASSIVNNACFSTYTHLLPLSLSYACVLSVCQLLISSCKCWSHSIFTWTCFIRHNCMVNCVEVVNDYVLICWFFISTLVRFALLYFVSHLVVVPWRFHNPFELVVDLWMLLNTFSIRRMWQSRCALINILPSTGSQPIHFVQIQIKCIYTFSSTYKQCFSWSRLIPYLYISNELWMINFPTKFNVNVRAWAGFSLLLLTTINRW